MRRSNRFFFFVTMAIRAYILYTIVNIAINNFIGQAFLCLLAWWLVELYISNSKRRAV